MKTTKLSRNVYLKKLDKRSGSTFNHYQHRIDMVRHDDAIRFINWAQDNLGYFLPWNLYLVGRSDRGFKAPNWVIRYQEPGNSLTEMFVSPDLVPFIMLYWVGNNE